MKTTNFKMKYQFLLGIALLAGLTSCKKSDNDYDATGAFETTEVTVSAEGSGKLLAFDVTEITKPTAITAVRTFLILDFISISLPRYLRAFSSRSNLFTQKKIEKKFARAITYQVVGWTTVLKLRC
jgi:HlyD family secretion protein